MNCQTLKTENDILWNNACDLKNSLHLNGEGLNPPTLSYAHDLVITNYSSYFHFSSFKNGILSTILQKEEKKGMFEIVSFNVLF